MSWLEVPLLLAGIGFLAMKQYDVDKRMDKISEDVAEIKGILRARREDDIKTTRVSGIDFDI